MSGRTQSEILFGTKTIKRKLQLIDIYLGINPSSMLFDYSDYRRAKYRYKH